MEPETPGARAQAAAEAGSGDRGRRRFLEIVVGLFTSLIGIAMAVPFLGSIIGSSTRSRKDLFSRTVPLSGLPYDSPVDVAYQQMTSDGFLRGETVRHVWAVKKSATDVTVFSPICPHLGCRYDWDPADRLFKCPCHGSIFRMDGTVVAGPAPRPLDTLPVEIKQGALYVEWEQFQAGIPEKKQV
jgi:menaquinol-cytochrome c reductase iron-sulfur subunit